MMNICVLVCMCVHVCVCTHVHVCVPHTYACVYDNLKASVDKNKGPCVTH